MRRETRRVERRDDWRDEEIRTVRDETRDEVLDETSRVWLGGVGSPQNFLGFVGGGLVMVSPSYES